MLIPWKEIYLAAILKPGLKILFLKFLKKPSHQTAHPQDFFEYRIYLSVSGEAIGSDLILQVLFFSFCEFVANRKGHELDHV